MAENNISRRNVLQGIAAGAAASGLAGQAVADSTRSLGHIVGLEPGAPRGLAKKEATSVHAELDFGKYGQAVAGQFPEEALNGLRNHPKVEYVEADKVKFHAYGETLPWGIDRVDADVVHSNGDTGNGADIAILDTGIDDDHPDLQANIQGGKAFGDIYCGSAGGGCMFGGSPNDNACNYEWSDDNNHGTHCAGIADAVDDDSHVVGVSTEANLWAGKVLDGCGSGSLSAIASGIEWAADQGFDVASMSLGASSGDSTLKNAVQYAADKGLLMVAVAGNDGPCSDCVGYPAAYSEVIAVSSTASDDSLSDFSSTGPEVELAAPGTDILSTVPPESSSDGLDTYSGTSMACPHVSGAGGQLMADGTSASTARTTLQDTAEDIGLSSNEQGYGLLDVEAAVGGSDDGSNSAPTVDSLSASEVETSDSDAEFDVAWDVGDSDGNLSTVDLVLTQDSDGSTEDSASISVSGDTASGTTRLVAAGDDGSGNGYTVDITVTDGSGATASDATSVSETESTASAPTVDSHSVSTRTTGPWSRVTADWAVSDADGDLDTVVVAIEDSGGSTLDSTTVSVSGSTASGSNELKTRGTPSTSVVTVTDAKGNSDSSEKSV